MATGDNINKLQYRFNMRPLPKAEYQLMKMMIDKYGLDDPSELFTCALRAVYETLYSENGEDWWIHNIIATYRNNPTEERTYEMPD